MTLNKLMIYPIYVNKLRDKTKHNPKKFVGSIDKILKKSTRDLRRFKSQSHSHQLRSWIFIYMIFRKNFFFLFELNNTNKHLSSLYNYVYSTYKHNLLKFETVKTISHSKNVNNKIINIQNNDYSSDNKKKESNSCFNHSRHS